MNVELIPSVVPHDKEKMLESLALIHGFTNCVQLDIDDDVFTERATLQSKDIPKSAFQGLMVEVHGMVTDTETFAHEWIPRRPKRIILHAESKPSARILQEISHEGIEPVIALKADSHIDVLKPYMHLVDSFLFLTISPPGEQGAAFQPQAVSHMEDFHEKHPSYTIECDGGVNEKTLEKVLNAGATRLVVGSALFGTSKPPAEQYTSLKQQIQEIITNQ